MINRGKRADALYQDGSINRRMLCDIIARLEAERPEVIRCKNCFWFNENAMPNDEDYPHFCHKLGIDLKDGNGFCAWSHKEGA